MLIYDAWNDMEDPIEIRTSMDQHPEGACQLVSEGRADRIRLPWRYLAQW